MSKCYYNTLNYDNELIFMTKIDPMVQNVIKIWLKSQKMGYDC